MKVQWIIDAQDVQRIRAFFDKYKGYRFVLRRIKRNVEKEIPPVTKEIFWNAMLSCLLSTQQRSGPYSRVTQFIATDPFLLRLDVCSTESSVKDFVRETIRRFGGLRRGKTIGDEAQANLEWLNSGGWDEVFALIGRINSEQAQQVERESAHILRQHLKGFGPKQSRNLLQSLGLTKYEIPVDSRVVKWLEDFGFPVKLSGGALLTYPHSLDQVL